VLLLEKLYTFLYTYNKTYNKEIMLTIYQNKNQIK